MNYKAPLAAGQSSSLLDLSTQADDWILLDGNKVSVRLLENNLAIWFPVPQTKFKVTNSHSVYSL
jgi:hypothetical protein